MQGPLVCKKIITTHDGVSIGDSLYCYMYLDLVSNYTLTVNRNCTPSFSIINILCIVSVLMFMDKTYSEADNDADSDVKCETKTTIC